MANILDDNEPMADTERPTGKPESGSRFSQFFTKANENNEPRRSSIIDELGTNASTDTFMQDFLRSQQKQQQEQQQQTSIKIPSPGDPSAYFAPISPAAKTENVPMNPLMEMLRKGMRFIFLTASSFPAVAVLGMGFLYRHSESWS